MQDNIEKALLSLSKSKFRSSFYLKEKEKQYVIDKGIETIREHAKQFVLKRLASSVIENDGKQTPYRGHPVFIAQHATATCCRACLEKWHNILSNCQLSDDQIEYIINLIISWINRQISEK